MDAIHVAIVAPRLENIGGQGIQAAILARGLASEGCRVTFVPIDPPPPRLVAGVRRVPFLRTLVNQMGYLPSLRALREADVVHVFAASYWSFLLAPLPAVLAGRMLGKRVILNYHSGEADDHLARWGLLVHPWLHLPHEIVVPSPYLAEVFARYGYQTRVVRNVVDVSRFSFRERSLQVPNLVSTRNLHPYYRIDNTLRAYMLLRNRFPQAKLTLIGEGSEEPMLRALARSLGGDGIRFLGRLEPDVLPRMLDEAELFVNSSVVDNQPMSVLEAFAAGLPVVSTPTGDIANLVRDGETGVIVAPNDPAAMAEAIERLLLDPQRARSMARRARQELDEYTWQSVRDGWKSAYQGTTACAALQAF
jgi:glycosyltransferase involved in cell wall biosynthesis